MALFTRLLLLLLAAAQAFAGDNLQLVLYENERRCGGLSAVCDDASFGQCCFKNRRAWGSGSANGGNRPGRAAVYAMQGTDYCRVALTKRLKIPVCLIPGTTPSVVGGIRAVRSSRGTGDAMADVEVTAAVEAELAFTTDTHHYIISNTKMSTLSEPIPKGAVAREAYFRKHADKVVERMDTEEVPVVGGEL